MHDDAKVREFHSGDCVVVPATRTLLRDGAEVEPEGKVFDLLLLLIRNHDRALGKQELVEALWGNRPITDAALSQLIYKARRACGDDGEQQRIIRTIYGRGLQWIAPVTCVAAEPADSATAVTPAAATATPPAPVPTPQPPAAPRVRRARWIAFAATGAVAVAIALLAWWAVPRGHSADAPVPPSLALLPIRNDTGDATLDWTTRGIPGLTGSLLGETHGIAVLDPIKVAKVWNFDVPKGTTRAQHVRKVTGAAILVQGTLRKLGTLYELSLQVQPGAGRSDHEIAITGAKPGELAVAAVPRIRAALELPDARAAADNASPTDPYLAQTFARGMDAAMHGRWADAKPYFVLCAKSAPDFLPCRLRLAQAQTHTDQLPDAQRTLQALLESARKSGDTQIAARTLEALADIALVRNRASDALAWLDQAAPLAAQTGDPALQTGIALKSANAAAVLKHVELAESHLGQAREWIATHHLQNAESGLHNAESFVAYARGDYAAAAKADHAALAASLAVGDEFGAMADASNLALALLRNGDSLQALPVFADVWQRAAKLDSTEVHFSAGNNLATILLQTGLDRRAQPIIEQLLQIADAQKSASWQSYALSLRSDWRWAAQQPAPALADARRAVALADSAQDPETWAQLQFKAALLALSQDRAALAGMAREFDAMAARQSAPAEYVYLQQLMHALAAAATGDQTAARAALQKAAAGAHPDDPGRDNLHRAGFAVALATRDPAAARIALADFDPAKCVAVDVLQLAAQWAQQQGDAAAAQAATRRIAALRAAALAALDNAAAKPPASPVSTAS